MYLPLGSTIRWREKVFPIWLWPNSGTCLTDILTGFSRNATHSNRAIEDFQSPGEIDTFLEHIRAGLRTLSTQPGSLLLLSGFDSLLSPSLTDAALTRYRGPTKPARTRLSEAQSYLVCLFMLICLNIEPCTAESADVPFRLPLKTIIILILPSTRIR